MKCFVQHLKLEKKCSVSLSLNPEVPSDCGKTDCVKPLTVNIGQLTNNSVVWENIDIDCNGSKQHLQDKNELNGSVSKSYGT